LTMMHRPTEHELTEQIDHYAQVQLPFIRLQLGDIRDPFGLPMKSRSK
jgi:hypothetical protein